MEKNQQGFSIVEVFLILVIVSLVSFVGWYVYGKRTPQPVSNSNYTFSSESYDANGTLFDESPPPPDDQMAVKVNSDKTVHLVISFKRGPKAFMLNYNGISVIHESLNGQNTQTINFHIQKINQLTPSTSISGLDVSIGSPKEFSNPFKPGHYLVKATIDTRDVLNNKTLGTEVLSSSLNY